MAPDAMDPEFETLIARLLDDKEVEAALTFLSGCYFKIPTHNFLNKLIYEVCMKKGLHDDSAVSAKRFLDMVLNIVPATTTPLKDYYKAALMDRSGRYTSLWSFFSLLIKSLFVHLHMNVQDNGNNSSTEAIDTRDVIPYPNIAYLLAFFVDLLASSVTADSISRPDTTSLVADLFWNSKSDIGHVLINCREFFIWMNVLYRGSGWTNEFQYSLHTLLNLMVAEVLNFPTKVKNRDALKYSTMMDRFVKEMRIHFKDIVSEYELLNMLVQNLDSVYLKAKICEHQLCYIVHNQSLRERSKDLTLYDIVYQYMFPHKRIYKNKIKSEQVHRTTDEVVVKLESERPSRPGKLTRIANTKDDNPLHIASRNGEFVVLVELLNKDSSKINEKNSAGYTPLHEACFARNTKCVFCLTNCQDCDLKSGDALGLTVLHWAAHLDLFEIAEELLRKGGPELLNCLDQRKAKPFNYATSENMKSLFREHKAKVSVVNQNQQILNSTDIISTRRCPRMPTFKTYSMYLHTLYLFLTNIVPLLSNDEDMSEFKKVLYEFIEDIQKGASKHDIKIEIELIPLKMLADSIQC